jgi:hypothetical protein
VAKHHYVPEFLLKHWHTPPDGRLSRFGWEYGSFRHHRRSARVCARERDLYRLHGALTPEAFEDVILGRVDHDGAQIHAQLIAMQRDQYDENERIRWCRFLTAMMQRHPEFIAYLRRRAIEEYDKALADFAADRGTPAPELETWLSGPGQVHRTNIALTDVLPDLINSDPINTVIFNASWLVRELHDSPVDLLLGDRPLIRGGVLKGGFILSLPLTPRHVFFAFDRDETGERIQRESQGRIAKTINRETVTHAHGHVFATSDAQGDFVRKWLRHPSIKPTRPSPYLSGS